MILYFQSRINNLLISECPSLFKLEKYFLIKKSLLINLYRINLILPFCLFTWYIAGFHPYLFLLFEVFLFILYSKYEYSIANNILLNGLYVLINIILLLHILSFLFCVFFLRPFFIIMKIKIYNEFILLNQVYVLIREGTFYGQCS
jgi:hypothetical protein